MLIKNAIKMIEYVFQETVPIPTNMKKMCGTTFMIIMFSAMMKLTTIIS